MKLFLLFALVNIMTCTKDDHRVCGRVAQIWPGEVIIRVNDSLLIRHITNRTYHLNDSVCIK
jgi:hypothetical protein